VSVVGERLHRGGDLLGGVDATLDAFHRGGRLLDERDAWRAVVIQRVTRNGTVRTLLRLPAESIAMTRAR
jgi:hypothetical protein